MDFSGKHVFVTGGSRGIGAACALMLAEAGADVSVGFVKAHDAANAVCERIRDMGRQALAVRGDLSQAAVCQEVFDQAENTIGSIDGVVVNAGIWRRASIDTMREEDWRETMQANLDSTYHSCHQAAKRFKSRGGGNLVLISSTAGQRGEAHYSHYAATKGAMIAMTRSLAAELGPSGIRVNCVAPGWVRTEMTDQVFANKDYEAEVIQQIPLRRIAEVEDIAGPVLFLLSDLAKHVQGAVINVNGGSVLC